VGEETFSRKLAAVGSVMQTENKLQTPQFEKVLLGLQSIEYCHLANTTISTSWLSQ